MTINPASVGNNAYDLLDGSVSAFYADVDEAIVASEVVKGQYRMTINPAYNAPNPVDSNSFTTVGLTQSGPMVVDLENSYITTEVELDLEFPGKTKYKRPADAAAASHAAGFFIGWKSSIEAVERYDIMVNSTPIYTQSFCGEESFVQYQVINDLVKNTSPFIYSTYENVIQMSPCVAGTYVVFNPPQATTGGSPITDNDISSLKKIKIPIKIPVSNFLILKNLKYLLSWMGKWEIRLYFSPQNLVVLPIPHDMLQKCIGVSSDITAQNRCRCPLSHNFCQIDETFKFVNNTAPTNADAIDWQVHCSKMTLCNVEMNTAQFQLRMDILEMLKQKYLSEKPLTFPVSTIQVARFTGPPSTTPSATEKEKPLNIVLCQAINNCDTLFVLPFRASTQHTTCTDPFVESLQLHAGEYGSYPTQPFHTYAKLNMQNIRFVNAVADALNVNASELCSFSRDVARTFMPTTFYQDETGSVDLYLYNGPGGNYGDRTNFFIPFPFSTDDDFQGGLSSPSSNINFKLTGSLKWDGAADNSPILLATDRRKFDTPWVAAFLIDGVIMIRPDPGSDAAKVIWSDRTVC